MNSATLPEHSSNRPLAAEAAAPRRVTSWRKFLVDVWYIWLEQMLEVRASWYFFLVFSLVLPLSMVFGFGKFGGAAHDRDGLLYIISGAAVFAVTNENIVMLAGRIGAMKRDGRLLYYAALPIYKLAFLAAIVGARLVLTLPSTLITLLVGAWIYGVVLTINLWVVMVLLLACLALATVGMAVGALLDSLDVIAVVTNLLLFLILMASPMFIPAAALPLPLQILGYLLPPTYAADALRLAIGGSIGARFYLDLAALASLTGMSMLALVYGLRWRVR
jgi:ABC-2 type transport system permease protein